MARKVFCSFHYIPDCARAAQVRNAGVVEGNQPVSDNKWEAVTGGGDAAIEKWIAAEMNGKSCAIDRGSGTTRGTPGSMASQSRRFRDSHSRGDAVHTRILDGDEGRVDLAAVRPAPTIVL
jgi:hypothetical protein